MAYMYGGQLLKIDLDSGKIEKEPTSNYQDLWLGGRGFNARILYEEIKKGLDPLDPDNVLMFSIGPFTGTLVPGAGRVEVAAKSPATGIQGMSNMGGYWGPEFKYAGYDSLIITGRANRPVYITINNDRVEIRDADGIWGLDTYRTQDAIRKELGDPDAEVLCIGPAGENLIAYASVQTRVGNAAGRTGMGTVMGSKNLKAIAVRGTKGVAVADSDRFLKLCLGALESQKPLLGMAKTTDLGDNDPPSWASTLGNYEATEWVEQKNLKGGHMPFWEKHKNPQGDGITGCFNCQVRCMDYYNLNGYGPLVASCTIYGGPTWLLKNSDMKTWYAIASKCQRQGIDTQSVSRMIAWAMELYEQRVITSNDTDGIHLTWGNGEAILLLIDKIVKQEGFGKILAGNVRDAGKKLGKDIEEPLNIKGVPLGVTNVMNFRARTMGALINPRGADEYRGRMGTFDNLGSGSGAGHMTGMASPDSWEGKTAQKIADTAMAAKKNAGGDALIGQMDCESRGELAALGQKLITVSDSLGQCKWNTIFLNLGVSIEFQAKALSAGTGKETRIEDLLEAAARISAQERAFAAREGFTREQDTLPGKLINSQIPGTWPEDKVTVEDLEKMKDDYYRAMGWNLKTGIPTVDLLQSLKLDDVASDFQDMGISEKK